MKKVNKIGSIIRFVSLLITLTSCNSKVVEKDTDVNFSFEYNSLGGKGILESHDTKAEIIKTKENEDSIEIDVYKWLSVPIGNYKGRCELKSDTLYIYYWEEIKEVDKNASRAAVILQSQLKYKIRKVNYKTRVVKLKDVAYVK